MKDFPYNCLNYSKIVIDFNFFMNFLQNQKKAFTLIEILVWISVISIVTLTATQIDFRRLSQKQNLAITTTEIITKIENIRNYALTGKWVWNPLTTPHSWTLEISTQGSGSIFALYSTWSIVAFPEWHWNSGKKGFIKNIYCEKLDGTSTPLAGTGTLSFVWDTINLSGCPDSYYRKLLLEIYLSPFSEKIEINTVSGIIEKK